MIYHGRTLKLANLSSYYDDDIDGVTGTTLKIEADTIQGSGSQKRTSKNYSTKKGWSVSGELFVTSRNFADFISWLKTDKQTTFAFYNSSIEVEGDVILTNISVSAPKNGLVRMSFQAVGNGMPTITIA